MTATALPYYVEAARPSPGPPGEWTPVVHAVGDTAALSASAVALLASFGISSPLQPVFALVFVLFAPGWALLRARGRSVGSIELLVAVAFSISVVALAGHVTVTVFDWHWAATTGLGSTAVLGTIARVRWNGHAAATAPPRARPVLRLDAFRDRAVWLPLATGLAGAAVAFVGLVRADEADIGRLGLYDTFGPLVWVGLAVLVASTVLAIADEPARLLVAGGLLGALIALLHGAPGIIEAQPRFFVAWIHVGFIEQISVDGALLPLQDARFSWPGFFAGGALLDQLAGTESTRWMIRFAPVVANGFYALAVWAMGSAMGLRRSVRLLAALVYVLGNWAGQDYFSPQATGMVLALTILVIVVAEFPSPGFEGGSWWRRLVSPRADEGVPLPADGGEARFGMPVLLVLAAALVVTHQLSPVLLAMALGALGVLRLTAARWFGVSVALMTLAWLSFGSEAFWFGQLEKITGSLGAVDSIVDANVNNKSAGAIAPRELLLRARLVLSFGVWFAAGVGALVAWRRAWDWRSVVLVVLVGAPFPVLALQPYGGEVLIRLFFFTLLAASLLIAMALFGGRDPRPSWLTGLVAVGLVGVLPLFVLARFGNEEFEATRSGDLAGAEVLMDEAPAGARVYLSNRQVLNEWRRVGDLRYVAVDSSDPADFEASINEDPTVPAWVFLSRSQEVYREQTASRPVGWIDDLVDSLIATGDYEVHYRSGPVAVLEWTS